MKGVRICPLHLRERNLCSFECEAARYEFMRIRADFRKLWYDRRRGTRPAPQVYLRHDTRPIWQAWARP